MTDPHFFINRKSWHYRYYSWIRKLYLGKGDKKEATSICPYFHTMLWGTVFAVLTSPILLFSSVGLRILRFILKINNPWIDWIDSETPVGDLARECRESLEDRPVVGAVASGLGLSLIIGLVVCSLWLVVDLIYYSPQIVSVMWYGVLWAGWAVFCIFGHVAWALEWAGYGVKHTVLNILDFLSNGVLWYSILIGALSVLASIISLCIVGLLFWGISKVSCMQRLGGWVMIRVNGYEQQREVRAERMAQRKKVKEEAKQWTCVYCGGSNYITERSYSIKYCYHCKSRNPAVKIRWWERMGDWFVGDQTIHLPRRPAWVSLGFLSSIRAGLWAIKHKVCPALTFVTDEELQQKVKEAVAADQNDDLAKRHAGIYNDLKCPECDKNLNIAGNVAGETVKCSGCGHIFVAPKQKSVVKGLREKKKAESDR